MSKFKPLLAYSKNPELSEIKYPVLASPKLDGFRCVIHNGQALTRSLKPIPNSYTREWLKNNAYSGLDGELLIKGGNFNDCQSGFMSISGEPNFEYHVFDLVIADGYDVPFIERYSALASYMTALARQNKTELMNRIKLVPHPLINSLEELVAYEEWCVQEGYEGVMIRDLNGRYKFGRSTLSEGILLKLKRWEDSEAIITGFEEQMTNTNEKIVNELGHSERSTHKAGMVPAGTLGKFIGRDLVTNEEVAIGSGLGLTKALRQEIWDNKEKYLGRIVSYKWQPHGTKDSPRFPIYKGFRHADDMA